MSEETRDRETALVSYVDGPARLEAAIAGLTETDLDLTLAADSWSIRQIVHHVVDGDDLWKTCIKAALGNSEGTFSLPWYWDVPQDRWAECWNYARLPLELSLDRFRANRRHIVQLLQQIPDAWGRCINVRWPNEQQVEVSVAWVVEMQARHVEQHVQDIHTIREAHPLEDRPVHTDVPSSSVIETMLKRKSVRCYTAEMPSDEVVAAIVRAGQQAPFAAQLCSVLVSRHKEKHPFGAPLLFTICVDSHRMERVMARRNWYMATCDLSLLLFGIQDASLMAENMVIAAESLGLGSCFLGNTPYVVERIIAQYKLPPRVFPLVQLAMGYPAEDLPPRPRYPLEFSLFEDEYPEFTEAQIERAMAAMDQGYLAQDYYRRADYMVPLEGGREERFTFDEYSWTEHISRKWGQWHRSPERLLAQLRACGFDLVPRVGGEVVES